MKDYNVLGKAQEDAPLPDTIDTADQLVRFVEFFVKQGWNVWPLPARVARKWKSPVLIGKTWKIGESALKWRWHLFLMGRIRKQFPNYFKDVISLVTAKGDDERGLLIVVKPLLVDDVLRFMAEEGYIKMAGRA